MASKLLIILLILSIVAIAFAVSTSRERYVLPLHAQVNNVDMVLHYKMWDGLVTTTSPSVFDYSLNGHVGTLFDTDAPATPTLIPTYPGFDFDGDNDYIEIADHADFTPALTPFSISAWINIHNSVDFGIAIKGIQGIDAEWAFALGNDEKLTFYLYKQSTAKHILTKYNTALTAYNDTWIYVVATYDGGILASGLRLYLNGTRVDDTTSASGDFTGVEACGYDPRLGFLGPSDYANGLIGNVMIWNKELTAVEAKNIYEITQWRYSR